MLAEGLIRRKSQFLFCPADTLTIEIADIARLSQEHYSNLKLRGGKKISDEIIRWDLTFSATTNYIQNFTTFKKITTSKMLNSSVPS